jgi:membrane protease YdiL (CAAX protease family)
VEKNESQLEDETSTRMITAVVFEGGLLVLALVLGWFFSSPALASIPWDVEARGENLQAIGLGVLATLPPIVGMLWLVHSRWRPCRDLQKLVEQMLIPMFRRASYWDLAAVAIAAGVGEEALFRGFMQGGLVKFAPGVGGIVLAIAISSILFGLAHAMSPAYFAMATLMSVYLGLVFYGTGNLLAPIVTHALYDFVTLVYLLKRARPYDSL